jgi:hypothetical protein
MAKFEIAAGQSLIGAADAETSNMPPRMRTVDGSIVDADGASVPVTFSERFIRPLTGISEAG